MTSLQISTVILGESGIEGFRGGVRWGWAV